MRTTDEGRVNTNCKWIQQPERPTNTNGKQNEHHKTTPERSPQQRTLSFSRRSRSAASLRIRTRWSRASRR